MYTEVKILSHGDPLQNADVVINGQSRQTDEYGVVTFEDLPHGMYPVRVYSQGRTFEQTISSHTNTVIDVSTSTFWIDDKFLFALIILSGFMLAAISFYLAKKIKFRTLPLPRKEPQRLATGSLLILFASVSLSVIYINRFHLLQSLVRINKSDQTFAAELASIPQPRNVKAYGDDRVATITWDPVSGGNVVGYYVKWGKKSLGTFTDSKQTIHPVAQIQPLENGVEYVVQVQSVQGTYTKKPTASEQGGSDSYATANGNLSVPVALSVTPTSARVDAMRSRLTGFFDDFNLAAGGFDETKWNHATTACIGVGEDGQFINSQFHAHNMARSTCDRAGNVSRPRAVFDITGRNESNPGQIEFDMDGVSQPRDVWYIDIIPVDARKNGMPIDVTSHNDLFDADNEDPGRMLRVTQYYDHIDLHYYDASNNPRSATFNSILCPTWNRLVGMDCEIAGKQVQGFSPIAQASANIDVKPNVRNHWVIQFSPQKTKLFINSAPLFDANTPAVFANITKYQIHSTLFTYNTGKQFTVVGPTTSMLHWDNFGFNGPAPTMVTHNYIDGGATGTTPLLSRGYTGHPVPSGNRLTKIPIPDPIGSPVGQARLMFTVQPFGYSSYSWNASQTVVVNGHSYPVPDPRQNMQNPRSGVLAETYVPLSTGVYISPSDLRQGLNDVQFNLGSDILNAHIEMDYAKSNAPSFTQPRDIFPDLTKAITPGMRPNDSYWFVEQTMGLPALTSGTLPSVSPNPTPTPVPGQTGFTIQPLGPYSFVKDILQVDKQIYSDETRFTFFKLPSFLDGVPYIKSNNLSIKDDRSLSWKITLNQRSEVYVLYRKIPGAGVPSWISSGYSKVTNDDLSNINQYVLRKNDQGLIGLYEVYKQTPTYNGSPVQVTFGPASDDTHTAFSMYMVAVKPL